MCLQHFAQSQRGYEGKIQGHQDFDCLSWHLAVTRGVCLSFCMTAHLSCAPFVNLSCASDPYIVL